MINEIVKVLNKHEEDLKIEPVLIDDWGVLRWHYVKGLHVHHGYYQDGMMAWEYPLDALLTLCWSCHETLHRKEKIEVRDFAGEVVEYRDVCDRCFGAGYFPQYKHVEYGGCFQCRGSKFM